MATRVVTGTFSKADGTALSGKAVKFTLKKGTYSSTNQYPKNPTITGRTNATGVLKAADGLADLLLWVDAEAVDPTPYVCTVDQEKFEFTIPVGTTPIDLSILRANGPAVPPANSTLQFLVDTHAAVKASATVLGHHKVGARLTMDPITGILSADVQTQDLSGYTTKAANLSDLGNAGTARTNLGLGSLALLNAITSGMVTGALGYTPLSPANNLSEVTPATARTNLGLGSVENTALSTWAGSTNLTTAGVLTATSLATALLNPSGNIIEQRNGVNAQTQRTYASFTDASNYTRGSLSASTTAITLATESAGTGSANIDIILASKGTGAVSVPDLRIFSSGADALSQNFAQRFASFGANTGGGVPGIAWLSNAQLRWTTATSGTDGGNGGTADVGLARASAGIVKVTNGSSGYGKLSTAASITWSSGAGSPEGVVTAGIGSLYTRTDGGANTTLYIKESGVGSTGWTAK